MINVNGVEADINDANVAELLDLLAIEPRGIAVAVNGEIVSRSKWNDFVVGAGSRVEIVTAAAGG